MSEVIQRTANGVDVISLDTFNCERRTLCIRGEITQESAFEFALTAAYLNSLSETEAITVYRYRRGPLDVRRYPGQPGPHTGGGSGNRLQHGSPAVRQQPARPLSFAQQQADVTRTPAGLPHRRQHLVHQDDAGDPGQTQHAPGKAHRQDPGTDRRNYETRPFLHR